MARIHYVIPNDLHVRAMAAAKGRSPGTLKAFVILALTREVERAERESKAATREAAAAAAKPRPATDSKRAASA